MVDPLLVAVGHNILQQNKFVGLIQNKSWIYSELLYGFQLVWINRYSLIFRMIIIIIAVVIIIIINIIIIITRLELYLSYSLIIESSSNLLAPWTILFFIINLFCHCGRALIVLPKW